MDKVKWDDIIKRCAEDYKALKSIEGVNLKTPPRDFIRAWMQVRYNIFKLSGYFYRKFNSLIIKENHRKTEDENLSESVFKKVKKISTTSVEDVVDKMVEQPISAEEIRQYFKKNPQMWHQMFSKKYKDLQNVEPTYDRYGNPTHKPKTSKSWYDIEIYFWESDNMRKLFEEFYQTTEDYKENRWGEKDKYYLHSIKLSSTWRSKTNFMVRIFWMLANIGDKTDNGWYWKKEVSGVGHGGTLERRTEEQLILLRRIMNEHSLFISEHLNESVFNKVKKTKSTNIENRIDLMFRYKIGDCYPSEEDVQGVICTTPEEMGEDAYLIMSPTFVDRLGKPTEDKGFRSQTNDFSETIRKYCKKHGEGWQLLTYDWAKKMGMMEDTYNIPWEEQKKVFSKFRDPVAKTVEKLGHKMYGTNMLIMQKEPNWSMRGNFNMGGWAVCDYNQGNMLRLFKKISITNESVFNKVKNSKVSDIESNVDEMVGLSDEQIKKMILKYGDCTDNEYNDWDWFFYPKMRWGMIPKDEAIFIDWTNRRGETKKYLLSSLSWSGGLENDEDAQPSVIFSTYYDDGDKWQHESDMGSIDMDEMRKNYFEEYSKIIEMIQDKVVNESVFNKVKKIKSTDVENKVDDVVDVEDVNIFFNNLSKYLKNHQETYQEIGKQNECHISLRDDSKTKTYTLRGQGQKTWEQKFIEIEIGYTKKQLSKKTQEVKKLFTGQLYIQIHNSLNYQNEMKFDICVKEPWSWDSARIDIPVDSFLFANGDSDLSVPSHQRFVSERYSGSVDFWKPNMKNLRLFIDMIEMIVYNFMMFNNVVNNVSNKKVSEAFRECFNMFKDRFYNESSESVYSSINESVFKKVKNTKSVDIETNVDEDLKVLT